MGFDQRNSLLTYRRTSFNLALSLLAMSEQNW
jgi:hypothetical protein